ncbi:MAG: uroporphyrinogen decarboxylase family protein [Bryobacterales bacterium]|nr:uroporphyrinogen decarboxylase family protein [Bryobacterales bacterium]
MNGYQRTMAALSGEWPDRRPVMLHNFMMAAREAGVSMREFRSNPAAIARCFIQSVETYGYDGIVVDVDTATLAGACGVPVYLPEDEPAICKAPRLASLSDVDELPPVRVEGYPGVQVWLEAVRQLRRYFGSEILVRGNCDQSPFALASMVAGAEPWMIALMDADCHASVERLLDWCGEATVQFIRLMADAGAHMISNGDGPAGPSLIAPRLYERFAWRWEQRCAAESHRLGLPYMLHICGKTESILDGMAATGSDALELDYKTNPARAREILGERVTFTGNIDPTGVLAQGTPEGVEEKVRELLDVFAGTPRLIINAGCAIPATTPPANLRALIRAANQ